MLFLKVCWPVWASWTTSWAPLTKTCTWKILEIFIACLVWWLEFYGGQDWTAQKEFASQWLLSWHGAKTPCTSPDYFFVMPMCSKSNDTSSQFAFVPFFCILVSFHDNLVPLTNVIQFFATTPQTNATQMTVNCLRSFIFLFSFAN